jgi:hypothetical protein
MKYLPFSPKAAFASTALLVCLATATAYAVGTRRFELRSSDDFDGGDLKGVAIDSRGLVRAGYSLGSIPIDNAVTVWDAIRAPDGGLLLGTGNDGRVLRVQGQAVSVVAETKALAVTALAALSGGEVALGTIPDGKIFKLKGGELKSWLELKDTEHVWALAFDSKTSSLYAATGPEGKLFRIDRDGRASVYFDAEEQHLVSVAVSEAGVVYAGAGDKGKLYAVSAPGRARVLYDFGTTEVRSIVVGKEGSVFAIANELKAPRQPPRRSTSSDATAVPQRSQPAATGKGVLYRFDKEGSPEELLTNDKDFFVSLALDAQGAPHVGTGAEGRVYKVDKDSNSLLVADVDSRQIAALLLDGPERFIIGSDPTVVHPIRGVGGPDAVWTSKVLDASLRAKFGRLSWEASGALEFSTRTGGTEKPDGTWSDWSAVLAAPARISSPDGRFLQIRARFNRDPEAVLRSLEVAFVTENLRARVVDVGLKRTPSSSKGVPPSGGPISQAPSSTVELTWKTKNPDEDALRYRLEYQLLGTKDWFSILPPREILTKESYSWNTQDLPEGRYRVRVTATDELANPPGRATQHSLESEVLLVDNTPPTVEGLKVQGRRILGTAVDGVGPIARIEVSVSGSNEWVPFFPLDGIFDEPKEAFDLDVSQLVSSPPTMLTLRVYDAASNVSLRHVTVR